MSEYKLDMEEVEKDFRRFAEEIGATDWKVEREGYGFTYSYRRNGAPTCGTIDHVSDHFYEHLCDRHYPRYPIYKKGYKCFLAENEPLESTYNRNK